MPLATLDSTYVAELLQKEPGTFKGMGLGSDRTGMSHKINHREIGQGEPLVLLHGYGGSVMHWDGVVERMRSHYRIVVPNISHLFMSVDHVFFSIQVEILAKYLKEHFPNQKVHLAGTSYGGALAWALSSHYPELVDRLILINPMVPNPGQHFLPHEIRYFCIFPFSKKTMFLTLATPIGKSLLRRFAEAFREERSHGRGRLDTLTGKKLEFVSFLVHRFTWILKNEDWNYWSRKLARQRGQKVSLLIYDRNDSLFAPETYLNFSAEAGIESVREISGAGHLAIKSRPDTVAQIMKDFLQGRSSTSAA